MAEKKNSLEELKKDYEKIQKKHNLPSFKELNEDFHIEKIAESETDILIREVRRFIGDKIASYLRFVETLFNPANAPVFMLSVLKSLGAEERKKLEEIYKKLSENELKFLEVDISFSEEKEADFIKNSFKMWQTEKKELLEIVEKAKKNWDNKIEPNNKGYFG